MKTQKNSRCQNSFQYKKLFNAHETNFGFARFCVTIVMLLAFSVSHGQTLSKTWKEDLASSLEEFLKCTATETDRTMCASYIEKSLAAVYKLDALNLEASNNPTPASSLSNAKGNHWSILGKGYEQGALESAQTFANENKAVIAVYKAPGGGIKHVALILPGNLQYSCTWGFNVPNSASFFITTPEKSYIGKGLSYAFAKNMIKDVTLFVRNN